MQSAGRLSPYTVDLQSAPSLEEAVRAVAESQGRVASLGANFGAARSTPLCLGDDCENTAQLMQQKTKEILSLFKSHRSAEHLAESLLWLRPEFSSALGPAADGRRSCGLPGGPAGTGSGPYTLLTPPQNSEVDISGGPRVFRK